MVSFETFVEFDCSKPASPLFKTRSHALLSTIILADFLSPVQAKGKNDPPFGLRCVSADADPVDRTYIFQLRQVTANPQLGNETSSLSDAIERFASWLESPFLARKVNLTTIDVVIDLYIKPLQYLKICGDVAKHSLPRLETNANRLTALLSSAGKTVEKEDAYLGLESFFEWFFDYVFLQHSSEIAEHLNNIRIGIYEYLQLQFSKSYHFLIDQKTMGDRYNYYYPDAIKEPAARALFWSLMNRVRSEPCVPRFVVESRIKRRPPIR